ncbi:lysylphosphatidylglycerol synthase domain-containing protein [Rhodoligotrophos defluvii]|uniref:lysylphosphatidylglycerol synthase domain-containing protein n=1 Tax=Rhodoligotrophos defluvii TaxID=2561934 RepID=UPI0010C9D7FE|nr:lysylphosphatidylglycerol synthase domain-containing protein [Rhodoligotrophos defluvii]
MRLFTALALAAGVALLGWLLYKTDIEAALAIAWRIGWEGAAAVLAVFAVGFLFEIIAWALTFPRPLSLTWVRRLWAVNMVGEALSVVMPFGALGGEPFKALLLNRYYRVPYGESTASLLIVQTMFALAQAPFVLIGLALVLAMGLFSPAVERAMAIAAVGLALFMALALVAVHQRWLMHLAARLQRSPRGRLLAGVLAMAQEVEQRIFAFMRQSPERFAGALAGFFLNWLLGAVEVWVVLRLVGHPLDFWDCWVIEAAVVLMRSATFFVPAHIGSLEAATVYVTAALTGSADVGLALALIRRGRELIWSAAGLAIGAWYSWRGLPAAGSC